MKIEIHNKNKTGSPTAFRIFIDIKIEGRVYRVLQRKENDPYRYGPIPEFGVLCYENEKTAPHLSVVACGIVADYRKYHDKTT